MAHSTHRFILFVACLFPYGCGGQLDANGSSATNAGASGAAKTVAGTGGSNAIGKGGSVGTMSIKTSAVGGASSPISSAKGGTSNLPSSAKGGTSSGGSSTKPNGGTTSSGGTSSRGGSVSTGGSYKSSGGTTGVGASSNQGGSSNRGGSSGIGGTVATGGTAVLQGGSTSSGGANTTTATGGTSTGGSSAAAGRSNGGSSNVGGWTMTASNLPVAGALGVAGSSGTGASGDSHCSAPTRQIYVTGPNYSGYAFGFVSRSKAYGDITNCDVTGVDQLCMSGSVLATENSPEGLSVVGALGINLNQDPVSAAVANPLSWTIGSITIGFTNTRNTQLRVQINQGDVYHCFDLRGLSSPATLEVSQFSDNCWESSPIPLGEPAGKDILGIQLVVPSVSNQATEFDFCLTALSIQ